MMSEARPDGMKEGRGRVSEFGLEKGECSTSLPRNYFLLLFLFEFVNLGKKFEG
jgi:hypothetical protein